jgi:hypothetical protein
MPRPARSRCEQGRSYNIRRCARRATIPPRVPHRKRSCGPVASWPRSRAACPQRLRFAGWWPPGSSPGRPATPTPRHLPMARSRQSRARSVAGHRAPVPARSRSLRRRQRVRGTHGRHTSRRRPSGANGQAKFRLPELPPKGNPPSSQRTHPARSPCAAPSRLRPGAPRYAEPSCPVRSVPASS